MTTDIIKALNWRYATKTFDAAKKVSEGDKAVLIEALRLSPSSFGLQPWRFFIVTDPEVRKKLRAAAYDQPQVTDASFLVVFTVNKNVDDKYVDGYTKAIADTRGVPIESLKGFEDGIKGSLKGKTQAEVTAWSSRQVYIALGTLLTSAAVLGVDACPMEGFDNAKVDEILGLGSLGFASLAFAAVGYRATGDKYANAKKVRFPKEQVITEIK
jgi:nitroreductase